MKKHVYEETRIIRNSMTVAQQALFGLYDG
jgi:hypothetical protein